MFGHVFNNDIGYTFFILCCTTHFVNMFVFISSSFPSEYSDLELRPRTHFRLIEA